MKRLLIPILSALLLAACGGGGKGDETKAREEAWHQSLTDTLNSVRNEMTVTQTRLDSLQKSIAEMLPLFTVVEDPRLVEGYTVYKGHQIPGEVSKPTLSARILKNGQLELICTYPGGSRKVFSKGESEEIGARIASEQSGNTSVTYIDNGAERRIALTHDRAKAIAATYRFATVRAEEAMLQRRLPMLAEKVRIVETRLNLKP